MLQSADRDWIAGPGDHPGRWDTLKPPEGNTSCLYRRIVGHTDAPVVHTRGLVPPRVGSNPTIAVG